MKPGEIGQILRQTNLWWRPGPKAWQEDDLDLRAAGHAAFTYEPEPLAGLTPAGLYMLRGPRRVGKTVELKRAIRRLIDSGVNPRRIIHASVDGWRANDLGGLVDVGRNIETRGVRQSRYWFIDEITGVVGDWASTIKWLRDNTPFREDCVVLTGSSGRGLDEAIKSLAGRRGGAIDSDRTLLPMGFGAFCRALGLEIDYPRPVVPAGLLGGRTARSLGSLRPWQSELVIAWEIYLTVGGFPQAVDDYLLHHAVGQPLVDALWDVVHGEAIRSQRFSATQTLSLLAGLGQRLAGAVNVQSLAADIDAARDNVTSRLSDLYSALLIWPLHLSHGGRPNLRAQSKIFFVDPLLARLASLRSPHTVPPPDHSQLSEQQLGLALVRSSERRERGSYHRFDAFLYHRTPSRSEVDFVGGRVETVPLESKFTDGPWRREARTVQAAFGRGILASRSILDLDGDVWAVPAAFVALLLEPE